MAPDFHLAERQIQLTNIFPWVYKDTAVADGLGEYYTLSLWSQPLHTIFGLFAFLNFSFAVQTKLFGFVILVLGFWGIWRLLDKFNINSAGKSVGSIFFLLNTFFLLLFDGGQLSLALAYSILPIAFYYFLKAIETDFVKDKLKFALAALILSISDPRIAYLLFILVIIFSLFKILTDFNSLRSISNRFFLNGIITSLVLIGFHMYWFLPSLIYGQVQLPQTYERISQVTFLSFSTLSHALLLQQPHWPQNVFGRVEALKPEFILIPLVVFSVLFLVKKNATVAFWLLISVISIFLSKGSNEPLGQIYSFLFTNIPGFSLFRDPTKFYFLITLSYSILLGFSLNRLSKIKFTPFLLVIFFIFLARPLFLGTMNGLFSFPSFQKEFNDFSSVLKNDTSFGRIFWMPVTPPLALVSPNHMAAPADRLSQKRPFAIGTKGTYETFNYLREAPYMGEIFDIAGISYIAYPYLDEKRDNLHPDNIKYFYTFLGQLSQVPWLNRINDSSIPYFKTKEHQDKFFITPNIWWVIGSDSIYTEATKSAKLKLAKNALIFAEEQAGLGERIDEIKDIKIVLNNKTELDLAASFLNSGNLLFPAKNLGFDPDSSGWWKREAADLIRWRSFLQDKYGIDNQDFDLGGGWAVGEGKRQFTIYNLQFTKEKILLARVMESSRSGSLKFYQGNQLVGEVLTKIYGDANIRWFKVGKLESGEEITIASEGDINVVNALAVSDEVNWALFQEKARQLEGRIVNFDVGNAQDNINPEITYRKINPTKYEVKVSNLKEDSLLVFSQNYDRFWKSNSQTTPLPVYSLLNGYPIVGDGEYIVEFQLQKYVYPGLAVSGLTLAVLVILLLI